MFKSMMRVLAVVLALSALTLALASSAFAHGVGITLTPAKVAPGDKVTIKGEDWDDTPEVSISLNGQDLGKIQADEDGTFTIEVTVPSSLQPGSYEITATNPEGEKATAELSVTAASAMASQGSGMQEEAPAGGKMAEPSGDAGKVVEWRVNTATTPAERGGAGVIIAALALVGIGLILSVRRQQTRAIS